MATVPAHFFVGRLSPAQRAALVEVVVRYLRAGFPDPGIGGFMGGPTRDEVFRRVKQDAILLPALDDRAG